MNPMSLYLYLALSQTGIFGEKTSYKKSRATGPFKVKGEIGSMQSQPLSAYTVKSKIGSL